MIYINKNLNINIYIYIYVNFNINIKRKFFFLSNWDGAPLGVGALRKLRTLCIGSGGTGNKYIKNSKWCLSESVTMQTGFH